LLFCARRFLYDRAASSSAYVSSPWLISPTATPLGYRHLCADDITHGIHKERAERQNSAAIVSAFAFDSLV
jgi:hypothetical protein